MCRLKSAEPRQPLPQRSAEVSKRHGTAGGDRLPPRFHQHFPDEDFNYGFCWCLYLRGFLRLQKIFVSLRLILSFLCFCEKTSYSFKPHRAAVSALQNPHLPASSLSSILLYLIYCLLTDQMGNTSGKHASGFTFGINTFYDYSHDLQQ